MAADLSRQKELHADPKAFQQIELVGSVRKCNSIIKNDKLSRNAS